jgi:hypothetical protein
MENIPEKWLAKLAMKDHIGKIAEKIYGISSNLNS